MVLGLLPGRSLALCQQLLFCPCCEANSGNAHQSSGDAQHIGLVKHPHLQYKLGWGRLVLRTLQSAFGMGAMQGVGLGMLMHLSILWGPLKQSNLTLSQACIAWNKLPLSNHYIY